MIPLTDKVVQDAFKKLKFADEISTLLGVTPPKTNLRLAQQTVVNAYPQAIKEFGDVIARTFFTKKDSEPITSDKVEDDLAAWLDDMHVEDGDEELETHCSHPKINTNHVELYRCSWCRNPSAVLKKCTLPITEVFLDKLEPKPSLIYCR